MIVSASNAFALRNAGKHDVGCARRNQVDGLATVLPCLDFASRELADDLIAVNNEAPTVDIGQVGETFRPDG